MADAYASHFGINNIPYGIASSAKRAQPQAATRIGDDVIFLAELAPSTTGGADLRSLFLQPTLNAFAAQPSEVHDEVRSKIQEAYNAGTHTPFSEPLSAVTLHLPVSIGDFTDYSASANHVLNAGEAIQGVRTFPPAFHKYPVGYAGRSSSINISGTGITRPLGQFVDYSSPTKDIIFGASRALDYELEVGAVIGQPVEPGTPQTQTSTSSASSWSTTGARATSRAWR